jgi:hypothetical protein
VADGIAFPKRHGDPPDGSTLIVADSFTARSYGICSMFRADQGVLSRTP